LFIEQAIEQQDGGLEFMGRSQHGGGIDHQGNGLSAAAGGCLLATRPRFDRGIEKLALHLAAR